MLSTRTKSSGRGGGGGGGGGKLGDMLCAGKRSPTVDALGGLEDGGGGRAGGTGEGAKGCSVIAFFSDLESGNVSSIFWSTFSSQLDSNWS